MTQPDKDVWTERVVVVDPADPDTVEAIERLLNDGWAIFRCDVSPASAGGQALDAAYARLVYVLHHS